MTREELSAIIGDLDDRQIAEAIAFDPARGSRSPERNGHMNRKRIITLALAAALVLALGVSASAAIQWFAEYRSLEENPQLVSQADRGAQDLARFAGGSYTADDSLVYEDGDRGQSDTTTYFYNGLLYSVCYYGSGEIHAINAREKFPLAHPGFDSSFAYLENQYPDAAAYKAKIEAAAPGVLDALHAEGWIAGEGSGIERAYCNAHSRFMDNCTVCSVLMTDGTAYELWLQPDTLEVEGYMFWKAADTPNTRNGLFTALHEGTEEDWWQALQTGGLG